MWVAGGDLTPRSLGTWRGSELPLLPFSMIVDTAEPPTGPRLPCRLGMLDTLLDLLLLLSSYTTHTRDPIPINVGPLAHRFHACTLNNTWPLAHWPHTYPTNQHMFTISFVSSVPLHYHHQHMPLTDSPSSSGSSPTMSGNCCSESPFSSHISSRLAL